MALSSFAKIAVTFYNKYSQLYIKKSICMWPLILVTRFNETSSRAAQTDLECGNHDVDLQLQRRAIEGCAPTRTVDQTLDLCSQRLATCLLPLFPPVMREERENMQLESSLARSTL